MEYCKKHFRTYAGGQNDLYTPTRNCSGRAINHIVTFSKTQFISTSLNYAQYSKTPVLQHSTTVLPAEPGNFCLSPKYRFELAISEQRLIQQMHFMTGRITLL
jgi:hypothetical protein